MSRKGQITIFIILGLILVFIIAFALSFNQGMFNINNPPGSDILEVRSCLDLVGKQAIRLSAISGGDIGMEYNIGGITLALQNNKNVLKNKSEVESQISDYVETHIISCIQDIFPDHVQLSFGNPKLETGINPSSVFLKMDLPMTIIDGGDVTKRNEFNTYFKSDFYSALNYANLIVGGIIQTGKINEDIMALAPFNTKSLETNTIFIFESNDYDFVFAVEK